MTLESLYDSFNHVSRRHSLQPFWFWNGPLTPDEVKRQIDSMVAQGVYGAHVHNRSGLRPRYMSPEYWELVRAAVEKSAEVGFELYFCDEYNWPSGEARVYTNPTYPSSVIAANPEFRMRSLMPEQRTVAGGTRVQIGPLGPHDKVVVGTKDESGALDIDSLREITADVKAAGGSWTAPDGLWELFTFKLYASNGVDGGQVDLMSPEAIRTFLDLIYENYLSHIGEQFGKAFKGFYVDHEGDYGWRLAWTPKLFESFKALKGYDLVPLLPAVLEEAGPRTVVVRCDYFDVVSTLYTNAFWQQIADWTNAHGVRATGHVWEEHLQSQAAFTGDHFRVQRAQQTPGIDSLFEWGRYPRHFKEAASVADYRGAPLTVENQGVQGMDNFLSLEKIKRATNMLGLWGTSVFIPHALNGNPDRIDFPEDWFERQPWWRYFHHYADHAARISAMNSDSRHVADIVLYYPIETAWAHGDVCFSPDKWYMGFDGIDPERGQIVHWHNVVDEVNEVYGEIIDTLPTKLWDLNIADHHYLNEAAIEAQSLKIGPMTFKTLLLPPMTTVRRSTVRRARAFVEAGGTLIALRRLPFDSMDAGRSDPELLEHWTAIFGSEIVAQAQQGPLQFDSLTSRRHPRAVWAADVANLLALLDTLAERDVRVVSGDAARFYAVHRVKDGHDLYWFVNDTDQPRTITVDVPVVGEPQRWNPETGEQEPLLASASGDRTQLRLTFAPWQGVYVVFGEGVASGLALGDTSLDAPEIHVSAGTGVSVTGQVITDGEPAYALVVSDGQTLTGSAPVPTLAPLTLGGDWQITPQLPTVPVWYARTEAAKNGDGLALGFERPDYNDAFWPLHWLSPEQNTIQDWWLLGIFDYHDHLGFNEVMLPETEIDLTAEYTGRSGSKLRWWQYSAPGRVVDLDVAFDIVAEKISGTRFVTAFALTHVYSPVERDVELRVVSDCNGKAWLNGDLLISERDDHQGYLEMRDAYGIKTPAHLRWGWNRLLLKVSQGTRFAGTYGFVARFCAPDGLSIPDLVSSPSPIDLPTPQPSTTERWYRLEVPPGAKSLTLPGDIGEVALFVDGAAVAAQAGTRVALLQGAHLLALRLAGDKQLPDALRFDTGTSTGPLRSWSHTGLSYYTGEFAYEKSFDLPAAYLGHTLRLDLGEVGTTAEVWVNGQRIGERVWQPFAFDISGAVHEGRNELKVLVANTASQERAGGHSDLQMWGVRVRGPELLDAVRENGLLGPVRLQPYASVEIALRPAAAAAD